MDSPLTIKESPKVAPKVAPKLGEHTDEILQLLGFDAEQIGTLRAAGAVASMEQQNAAPVGIE